ncbi:MAG: FtsX-like permease family protein, partial [Candidatus Omnitrophica bacterium]|nr:FtsX-like permease family protein [Candidatus Omnitrophota bacterium]
EWFSDPYERSVILSKKMVKELRLTDSDIGSARIWIYGREFIFKGIFDEKLLNDIKDMDDERITPVDFSVLPEREVSKIKMEKTAQVFTSQAKLESFVHTEAENIAIVPFGTLMNMKGTLQSIAVKFNDDVDGKGLVESFISKLAVIIFAGIGEKTYVYSSMGLTSFSGISNLVIPILIAALIVLNTMLGAVYERIREIGTYSAVGLAPVHISSLFLAESMVYAVMGSVAGYLLGQVVARILMVTGLLKGLVLNYSSLSAVFATLIIFITVILSTLYPARKAAQMAVPDVTRKWILPEPKGDNWEFEFPFTVAEIEVLGLSTFLTDYFNSYQDVSLGNFYTGGATLEYEKLPSGKYKYIIDTDIWLAPFDLGVSQHLKLTMEPMGQYEFYTINLIMKRTSGESTDWKRLNRRFLDGIRKQFLIWRTVSGDVKRDYARQGKELLKIT